MTLIRWLLAFGLSFTLVMSCGPLSEAQLTTSGRGHGQANEHGLLKNNLGQENNASIPAAPPEPPKTIGPAATTVANAAMTCPVSDLSPDTRSFERDREGVPFVDNDRDIKDEGTTFVNKQFFASPDTLYNFIKLVYGTIDNALTEYKKEKDLEDRAVFMIFKGGNVLRIVANRVFDMLNPEARELLKEFAQYFQRSDSDFSVYIDEKKLKNLDYDKTFIEITELVLAQLNKIRDAFKADPQRYFNFMQLRSDFAAKQLKKTYERLPTLEAVKNKNNPNWFNAHFIQMQLLDDRVNQVPLCKYMGQYDFRYESDGDKILVTRLSDRPDWIVNSDNRTLEWPWGSDPNKKVKFTLVRSKAYFEYTFEHNNKLLRKPIGGELIDVSIPHRDDSALREFLDNYDKNVAKYTISNGNNGEAEKIAIRAYSVSYLAKDLQTIIFNQFSRPWESGPKYIKRVNRLLFLFIAELLDQYGSGSQNLTDYIADVREKILTPFKSLYPLQKNEKARCEKIKCDIEQFINTWPETAIANDSWFRFSEFVQYRLINNPQEGDEAGLKELLETIEKNLSIAEQLGKMDFKKIDLRKVYNVELRNLF